MKEQLAHYFWAEKTEGAVFVLCGVIAIATSIWLWASGNTYRGMAIPLVLIAFIQLGVGGVVYARSDAQASMLSEQLAQEPAKYKEAEVTRMEKVMRGFRTYKIAEVVIFGLGLGLTIVFAKRDLAYAAGIGCVAQASVMLVCDLFAEHRGQAYLDAVRALSS